jgi:hypothetical protein
MKYKVNRPKLTRQDLMDSAQQYAMARPQALAVAPVAPAAPAAPVIPTSARSTGFTPRTQQIIDNAVINSARRREGLSVAVPFPLNQQVGSMAP